MYISHDIVFDETVFLFSSLHSNAGARLCDEINLIPLSLQPLNFHYHEGLELREPIDVNPANPVDVYFLQNLDHDFPSDDESGLFPASCGSSSVRSGAGAPSNLTSGSPADSDTLSRVREAQESAAGPA
jgi:hypothetical protein